MSIDWEEVGIRKRAGVDAEIISAVQKSLGITFPELYVDLVMHADCALPEISSFEYQGDGTCISEFFEFSTEIRPYTVSWYARPEGVPGLPRKFIPIARDAGDYLICLDFNKSPVSVEIFNPNSRQSIFVANSFDEFVSMWHE